MIIQISASEWKIVHIKHCKEKAVWRQMYWNNLESKEEWVGKLPIAMG